MKKFSNTEAELKKSVANKKSVEQILVRCIRDCIHSKGNWIVFLKILLLHHLFCYITWLDATPDNLQTRPLRQILLFLWNNIVTRKEIVWKRRNFSCLCYVPALTSSVQSFRKGTKPTGSFNNISINIKFWKKYN